MPFSNESARGRPQGYGSRVSAIGTYAPSRVLTNADLSRMVDTNDEWIVRRTGIRERRMAADDEFTSDLCTAAAADLLARHEVDRDAIGMVIACTTTPDFAVPSVACLIQDRLGLRNAGAIDLNATCAGFVYGLQIASAMTATGSHRAVLVVAGETLTKVTDYTDRTTCILFGDAAGAGLVEQSNRPTVLASNMGAEGSGGPLLYRTGLSKHIGDGQHLGISPPEREGSLSLGRRDGFGRRVRPLATGWAHRARPFLVRTP